MEDRHHWSIQEIETIYEQAFFDLLNSAHQIHRKNFQPHEVQISTLLSIKTGSCPEDCSYCPQSAHYKTQVKKESLLSLETVLIKAKAAKSIGAKRFCMGAAWRNPSEKNLEKVIEMVRGVKALGLETCATLGMLNSLQAKKLKEAGLDFYNHNLDTSPEFYPSVIRTRTYQDRLDTLKNIREAGLKTCCGGILGLGESITDRFRLLQIVANLPEQPKSFPINLLQAFAGTPLEHQRKLDPFEVIRFIATARIVLPQSVIRLAAGRASMNDEMQALCFFAGANSIFYGETLLTAKNTKPNADQALFKRLNLNEKIFA